jgi:hypothetical protein
MRATLIGPWLAERACGFGGAGAPCPICNAAHEMPEGLQADAVNKNFWKINERGSLDLPGFYLNNINRFVRFVGHL